jgi:hypothetical protein
MMFARLISKYRVSRTLKAWDNMGIDSLIKEYLYGTTSISQFSRATKAQITETLHQRLANIITADNGFLALRQEIAAAGYHYASLQVLALKEHEKTGSIFDCLEISGELYKRIREAYLLYSDIREGLPDESKLSNDDIIGFINGKCILAALHLNSLNMVRAVYNDVREEDDWFRAFVRSMLIWTEDHYRSQLAMPSLLTDPLGGLKHSTFFNMVANGCKNPLLEWKQTYNTPA